MEKNTRGNEPAPESLSQWEGPATEAVEIHCRESPRPQGSGALQIDAAKHPEYEWRKPGVRVVRTGVPQGETEG